MIEQISSTFKRLNIAFVATNRYRPTSMLDTKIREDISGSPQKRKFEFSTARWCARKCLDLLGFDGPPTILIGKSGEPLWPEGVTGSISHSNKIFCASAALVSHYLSMGIDIEFVNKKISDEAFRLIVNEDETDWLSRIHDDRDFFKLLIFSAKESLFKTLFPVVKKKFYFDAVSILPAPSKQRGNLKAILNETLHPNFKEGRHFDGCFFSDDEWLLTFFCQKK